MINIIYHDIFVDYYGKLAAINIDSNNMLTSESGYWPGCDGIFEEVTERFDLENTRHIYLMLDGEIFATDCLIKFGYDLSKIDTTGSLSHKLDIWDLLAWCYILSDGTVEWHVKRLIPYTRQDSIASESRLTTELEINTVHE